MIIVNYIEHYLYTLQRDVFVLSWARPSLLESAYNGPERQEIEEWLRARNIDYRHVYVDRGCMAGDFGWRFVDFKSHDDPNLIDYCAEFENPDGSSKHPDKYNMYCYSHADWVQQGGIAEWEQHLADLANPDIQW